MPIPLVFLHSPLVGPATWQPVAEQCRSAGHPCLVPDLTPVMRGPGPYLPGIVAEAAATSPGQPAAVVGHSGAGPLLPAVAAALPVPVRALVYVDAGLPTPGQSWCDTAPEALVTQLRKSVVDGWLPPWHTWFPPETLVAELPDPVVRARVTAELGRLPWAFFQERRPDDRWPGPAGYLLLSEGYRSAASQAAAEGMPMAEHLAGHLALVADPHAVASAIRALLTDLPGRQRTEHDADDRDRR